MATPPPEHRLPRGRDARQPRGCPRRRSRRHRDRAGRARAGAQAPRHRQPRARPADPPGRPEPPPPGRARAHGRGPETPGGVRPDPGRHLPQRVLQQAAGAERALCPARPRRRLRHPRRPHPVPQRAIRRGIPRPLRGRPGEGELPRARPPGHRGGRLGAQRERADLHPGFRALRTPEDLRSRLYADHPDVSERKDEIPEADRLPGRLPAAGHRVEVQARHEARPVRPLRRRLPPDVQGRPARRHGDAPARAGDEGPDALDRQGPDRLAAGHGHPHPGLQDLRARASSLASPPP